MADLFGYSQEFTDKPGMWTIDGYAQVIDGYGNLAIFQNQLTTTGTVTSVQASTGSQAGTGAIQAITQTANSSGIYNIFLKGSWFQLEDVTIKTVIPSGTPSHCFVQINSTTVGNANYGPQATTLQSIKFTVIDLSTLAAGVLNQNSGIVFSIRLKQSSA